jgi:hypothetical protein
VAGALIGGKRKAGRTGPEGRRSVRAAAIVLAGVAALYALSSAVLGASGAVPTAPVFFGLDVDNYYFWQMIFILPLIFAVWGLFAGVLLAVGKKDIDRRAVLVDAAMTWGAALLIAWVPSAVEAAFMALGMGQEEWVGILSEPGLWQTAYLGFYLVAAFYGTWDLVRAARIVHAKSWPAAVLRGLTAAAAAILAFVAFVR